jgi:ADP-ribosylglycohydrolase
VPTDNDLAKTIIDYYHSAEEGLPKQFIEEYYQKAIYRDQKCVFGGQPTNGALMGIAPFGVINACNPEKALSDAFDAIFTTEGYARYATAIAAAMIASAMKSDATVDGIISDGLDAAKAHKQQVEGHRWQTNKLYDVVGLKSEELIRQSVDLAKKHGDPYSLREELLNNIQQQFGADASETLAIAVAMFYAAKGDYVETVKGAVNCGRDNDSSASVAGAMAGAFCGLDKIPPVWIELVETVNPAPTFHKIAKSMEEIIISEYRQQRDVLNQLELLL